MDLVTPAVLLPSKSKKSALGTGNNFDLRGLDVKAHTKQVLEKIKNEMSCESLIIPVVEIDSSFEKAVTTIEPKLVKRPVWAVQRGRSAAVLAKRKAMRRMEKPI